MARVDADIQSLSVQLSENAPYSKELVRVRHRSHRPSRSTRVCCTRGCDTLYCQGLQQG